jgi:hypothetical protein
MDATLYAAAVLHWLSEMKTKQFAARFCAPTSPQIG